MVDFQSRETRGGPQESVDESDDDTEQETNDHVHGHDDEQHAHDHHAHDEEELGVGLVTISSTRSRDEDPSGDAIQSVLEDAGHDIVVRDVIRDDHDGIQNTIDTLVGRDDVECVVTTGGTGVTPDDVTVEAAEPLFEKALPGFGELFRLLSYEQVGTKAICTRATAGIADGVPVFCLPGSENAAKLGTRKIIVEEAPHLTGLANPD